MAKEGAKRRVIKPNFKPQIKRPLTSGLVQLARELKLHVGVERKNGKPTLAELGGRYITERRKRVSMENTGIFYLVLGAELYGGKIMRRRAAPLFEPSGEVIALAPDFRPDILVPGGHGNTYIEVKSVSITGSKPQFAHRQFLHYSQVLLEDNGSEMYALIFRYGTNRAQELYKCEHRNDHVRCNSRCLAKKLSDSTRDVLLVPHNLLTFLFTLSRSDKRDHTSSRAGFEDYRSFFGKWVSLLHEHFNQVDVAINKIVEHAKNIPLTAEEMRTGKVRDWDEIEKRISKEFYLEDLETKQYETPKVYCGNSLIGNGVVDRRTKEYRDWKRENEGKKSGKFKVDKKPVIITEYRIRDMNRWTNLFRRDFNEYLIGMEMAEDYQRMIEWAEERDEQDAIRSNGEADVVIETPDDGIPI